MKNKKSILFLSPIDFKEKSIQVIRKTPETYRDRGWEVDYIVFRDNSMHSNYFYEKEINPKGINIIRFYTPLKSLKNKIKNKFIRTILSKLTGYYIIFKLYKEASKKLTEKQYDVVYGYEVRGVLAVALLRLRGKLKETKTVHRFQGTWLMKYLKEKKFLKLFLNLEAIIALKLRADLCIMTDDGTKGLEFCQKIKSNSLNNVKFWINGVDEQKLDKEIINTIKQQLKIEDKFVFVSISRLIEWKRVDRAIEIINLLVNKYNQKNVIYYIIGEGNLKKDLETLVQKYNLESYIKFIGAVPNQEVKKYLNISDVFFSFYDLSNVGNPLLEAIRANKIIFTLNNGDTAKWIQHKTNGFIYELNDNFFEQVAKDILELMENSSLKEKILHNIRQTEKEKLWTWKQRLNQEVDEMEKLL